LRRLLRWLVGLPIVLIVIAFAVANRRWVTLSLDPFSQDAPSASIDLPLWILFFLGIFVGLLVGWAASWWAQGKHRKAARDARAESAKLQSELAELRRASPPPQSQQQDVVPFNGGFL
jgi:uncharacterized integral membrane protein